VTAYTRGDLWRDPNVHIRKTLADLIAQRAQIDRAISALEDILSEKSAKPRRRRTSSTSKTKRRSASRARDSRGTGKLQNQPHSQASARIIPFHVPKSHRPRKLRPWRAAEVISI